MPSANVQISDECKTSFEDMKTNHKHRYLIFKFSDDFTEVQVDKKGAKDAGFADLLNDLPKDKVRYFAYDCKYETKAGQARDKILLVNWSNDDTAAGKDKMLLSSTSKDFAARVKEGVSEHVTINDWEDLNEENLINLVSKDRTK